MRERGREGGGGGGEGGGEMEGTGCKEIHHKGGHVGFVFGEVSGEDEILHEREHFLSLVGWQVVQ